MNNCVIYRLSWNAGQLWHLEYIAGAWCFQPRHSYLEPLENGCGSVWRVFCAPHASRPCHGIAAATAPARHQNLLPAYSQTAFELSQSSVRISVLLGHEWPSQDSTANSPCYAEPELRGTRPETSVSTIFVATSVLVDGPSGAYQRAIQLSAPASAKADMRTSAV